jgi:hypothetical protein
MIRVATRIARRTSEGFDPTSSDEPLLILRMGITTY